MVLFARILADNHQEDSNPTNYVMRDHYSEAKSIPGIDENDKVELVLRSQEPAEVPGESDNVPEKGIRSKRPPNSSNIT